MKRLLLITDRNLDEFWKGPTVRIKHLLKAFALSGYDVALICAELSPNDELNKLCNTIVVTYTSFPGGSVKDYFPAGYTKAVSEVSRSFQPHLVIVEYLWMATCLDFIKCQCTKAIDTMDVMHEHSRQYTDAGWTPWMTCSIEEEKELLQKADTIIAIQETEAQAFRNMLPNKQVICIPHIAEVKESTTDDFANPVIGFIGSMHRANEGIVQFVEHAWPLIKQQLPVCKLLIAGTSSHWFKEGNQIKTISFFNDITLFYHSVTIVICPIVMGTGLKIKFVEALLYGKAIVATSRSVEGIPYPARTSYVLADDWKVFAQKTLQLLNEPGLRKQVARNALQFAVENFSYHAGIKKIESILINRES